tara:strand:- start:11438 stop:11614 length:177 start_codon:yes stop_codon:yes gene_type:complete
MKRNCNGCRALNGKICALGKKMTFTVKELEGYRIKTYKPLEECPKPKTYRELLAFIGL